MFDDDDLYQRGSETMVASWAATARGTAGAALRRLPGVAAAVFPTGPEREFFNNALLARGLGPAERAAAVDAMEAAYAEAGITAFAGWVHESDKAMRDDLAARGYAVTETTRAMGMELADVRVPRPHLDLAPPDWAGYLRYLTVEDGLPGLMAGVDPAEYHVLLARLDGEVVTTALGHDLSGDRGVYNVGTVQRARRRGLGTALTALLVHDAADRGLRTASLQSTPMAERVYAGVGFRDLGRFLEHTRP
jgi:GNAT superfamily N-acetyltransferase